MEVEVCDPLALAVRRAGAAGNAIRAAAWPQKKCYRSFLNKKKNAIEVNMHITNTIFHNIEKP